jgi:hypothetical protein
MWALQDNTIGVFNTAVGYLALGNNTTGNYNTAIGTDALYANTVGQYNTAGGRQALYLNTTGDSNTAFGMNALDANTTGAYNTAVGHDALGSNITGTRNSALGQNALFSSTGSYNTGIGHQADSSGTTGNYNTSLGYNAQRSSATASGEFTLGDANVSNLRCNDTTISSLSDGRDKTDVVDNPYGLDFVNTLKPRKFTWATREGNVKDGETRLGFIAQELLEAADGNNDVLDLVYESNPDRLEAKYGNLIPVLTKAIQELSAKVAELEAKVN